MSLQTGYLTISDFFIRVSHSSGPFSRALLEECRAFRVSSAPRTDAHLEILEEKRLKLPGRAVLKGNWPAISEKEYRLGNVRITVCPHGAVVRDDKNLSVTILARGQDFLGHARTAVKWLIIKTAERKKHAFIHASALRYRGRNIVFAGDSGSGKTSFMLRAAKLGAEVICDDAFLAKQNRPVPFLMKFTEKGDFKKRFERKENVRPAGKILGKGIDLLIFPKVWNHSSSRVTPLGRNAAIKELARIYQKEAGWNSYLEPLKRVDKNHRGLLKRAKCFVFYAGNREEEVRRVFKRFLKGAV